MLPTSEASWIPRGSGRLALGWSDPSSLVCHLRMKHGHADLFAFFALVFEGLNNFIGVLQRRPLPPDLEDNQTNLKDTCLLLT